jgi:prevent-host-death family protein
MDEMPIGEGRARLAELVDRVRRTREPFTLTRNGRPVVVLVDPEEWALVSELAERVEQEAEVAALDRALASWDGETTVSFAEVLAELEEDEAAERRRAG